MKTALERESGLHAAAADGSPHAQRGPRANVPSGFRPHVWCTLLLTVMFDIASVRAADASQKFALVTLDPGHFHAALFQKEMLPGVSPRVHVYAPFGPDLLAHLGRVNGFNSRKENPTTWEMEVHAGPDFLKRLLAERPANVVVLSGNNRGKMDRIQAIVRAGLHALADKPWMIEREDFPKLGKTLELARQRRVVAYDAMTQRYEITCILQKELVNDAEVFGTCLKGSQNEPAVYMESVHFLKKEVAGAPLLRPAWFFDIRQQGEPLADVGTHLVDLVQWMLFPEQPLDYRKDIVVLRGTHKPLILTRAQFQSVTGVAEFPAYLKDWVQGDRLDYFANNSVSYTLRGHHVELVVLWEFEAPPGGKDTELSVFRGSRSRVEVRQGKEENYVPEVYVVPNCAEARAAVEAALQKRLERLCRTYAGLSLKADGARFRVMIPDQHRVGHEAHFALLVREFLGYLRQPKTLPAWETPYMLAKYYVTTEGVKLARMKP
ncbi:MAG: oxidoreductase [Verrucomicrobia bacterium]|nr:oxidoreductase [Verrucomicrobiota bacterium]